MSLAPLFTNLFFYELLVFLSLPSDRLLLRFPLLPKISARPYPHLILSYGGIQFPYPIYSHAPPFLPKCFISGAGSLFLSLKLHNSLGISFGPHPEPTNSLATPSCLGIRRCFLEPFFPASGAVFGVPPFLITFRVPRGGTSSFPSETFRYPSPP